MVHMLNKEQKEFFYHVLHLIKTSDEPFYYFLSGGAGHLTKALYQAALKYYNTRAGVHFAEIKVLILAIHSALGMPTCQSLKNYNLLDSGRLNTLRCQLGGVKLIFIDEISMVGNGIQSTRRRFNLLTPTRQHIKSSRDVGELVLNPI